MRFSLLLPLLLLGWTLFSFEAYAQSPTPPPPPAEPAPVDAIVVEAGEPVPVPLQDVAERLRAELPGSNVRVATPGESAASSVTVGLLASGELRIVYRDASGRETTRIVADTADPRAVAATIAMIVANLHQSQLASVLGPPPAAPAPPVAAAAPAPPVAAVPAPAPPAATVVVAPPASPAAPATRPPAVALVGAAAPATPAGWTLELGGLYAVVAASAVVGVSHDTASGWRLGMRAVLAYLPEDESAAFATDFVAARLGRTRPGRFDFGVAGGLLLVDSGQTAGLHAGPFAQYAHRLSIGSSIGARLGLDVALIDGEASLWPTAALFWELPLG